MVFIKIERFPIELNNLLISIMEEKANLKKEFQVILRLFHRVPFFCHIKMLYSYLNPNTSKITLQ